MTEVWEPYAPAVADVPHEIRVGDLDLRIIGAESEPTDLGRGVLELEVRGAGEVRVEWRIPCTGATAYWTPTNNDAYWLPTAWAAPTPVSFVRGAPVAALIGQNDRALCAFAAMQTDAMIGSGVVEATGDFRFWVKSDKVLRLRIDRSGRHFARCLQDLVSWWPGSDRRIPDAARMPVYSTWYSMMQEVSPERIEQQAVLAKAIGCDSIIVDDGWMTTDRARAFGHCGDWEPLSLPETAAHVARVRSLGMAYMLWYGLPLVGQESSVWEKFQPYALQRVEPLRAIVVDPRYPVVREHLVETTVRAIAEWGMDGFKFDFLERFTSVGAPPAGPEADFLDVGDAVAELLRQIVEEASAGQKSVLLESRQPYIGHGFWPYATMVRAVDCPLSTAQNRRRTIDLRLTAGPIAVHADMVMWHPQESAEQIAAQLISILFSVPQISVDLAEQTPEQIEALSFWLGFFRRRAKVLQQGEFEPSRPDLGYPVVRAGDGRAVVVARYAPVVVDVPMEGWSEFLLANADADSRVTLAGGPRRNVSATVRNARGHVLREEVLELGRGTVVVEVPTGGLLSLADAAKA
ncbi:glycoside hydrolase family 36 protein [Kitasatospora sp. NPDC087314]|uniref:glycoside hydrolase family 36 protein n=1 Tax=Kitasatospora sp. NPDC087314 TaxID=3364068 RepID=UPI00381BE2A4